MKMPMIRSISTLLATSTLSLAALYATITAQQFLITSERNKYSLSEALFLPQKETVKLLSFGYQKVAANYLWFKTINYFGKHYAKDQDYQWLFHMCSLVATLDPKSLYIYEFGSTILSWEASQAAFAANLLTQGIESNPDSWKLYYLRGFNAYYFLNDLAQAKNDFIKAAQLPGAHPIAARLAAKTLATQDDPKQAIEFLNDTLKATSDASVRQVLIERLRELHYEEDLRILENALAVSLSQNSNPPKEITDLVPYLSRPVSANDPFGGEYQIDPLTKTIRSTSNHKRLGVKK